MATQTINDMSVTWNSGATTFAGIKMDVTDTSSAAASALLDLEVGSSDVFYVGKDGALNITTAAADAVAVGLNGATNPAFQVDASTGSMATGIKITGKAAASGVALAAISSGTNEALTIDAKGSGTITLAGTSTGDIGLSSPTTITAADANGLTVGANGDTNPVLKVDTSTASVATGISVTGAAATAGVAVAALSSGTNENLTIDAKGSGTITLNGTATGAITCTTATEVTGDFTVNTNKLTVAAASGNTAVAGTLAVTGNTTLTAALIGTPQALSGAGAINVTTLTTFWTTTAADAGTLADGTAGQIKHIVMVADGGDGTLTPSNFGNGTTITFADVGDAVTLAFDGTNWWVVGSQGAPAIA